MPYLQRNELPPAALDAHHALANLWGDLICPFCGCQIVTPPGVDVTVGWGRCPRCHGPFRVGGATARVANLRAAEARRAWPGCALVLQVAATVLGAGILTCWRC